MLINLEYLDASYNELVDLNALVSTGLRELRILRLSNNKLTKIGQLQELKKLYELDLSKNMIRFIDKTSFPLSNMISCLKLEDNQIRNLNYIDRLQFC